MVKSSTLKTPQQKTVSFDDALKQSVEYFNGDELAATTWLNKYAIKDFLGNFQETTPDAMHRRMAREFERIEKKYKTSKSDKSDLSEYGQKRGALTEHKIYNLFKDFKYVIPQGSVMASLGNKHVIASFSNCIVLPEIHDSYGGICYTDQQLAQLFKRRCGVGIDISTLRPEGMYVSNAAGTTTGAVSFMERFSNTTREVAQNGRRGALMITMDIGHPDIEKFITVKQDLTKITGANISVRISDKFMKAVEKNEKFTLQWPLDSKRPQITKEVDAKSLWDTIVDCAHKTAEPGIIYWDKQHHYSTSSVYPEFKNVSTNPCSEIAMQGGDSCRLIAVNLFSFVDKPFTPQAKFNYKKLYEVVYEAQRLMDDLVDLELEAIEKILAKIDDDNEPDHIKRIEKETWELLYKAGKTGRRTGLGFTALADAVAALGLPFDDENALTEVEKIMRTKCEAEFESSIDMAIERGQFEIFDPEIERTSEFCDMLAKELPHVYNRMINYGRRNISISTVAPTGTLSMLAQTSSGIEPVFMMSYKRKRKINPNDKNAKVAFIDDLGDKWEEFKVYHPKIKNWMEVTGETDELNSPYAGSTAPELDWKKRVKIQGTVQKYITHSISSTINLPESVSKDRVKEIYREAWKCGLKGITVYRDGSRSGVLVSDKEDKKEEVTEKAPKRPDVLEAEVIRFNNNDVRWLAFVGIKDGKPYEVFTGKEEDAFVLPKWVDKGWILKNKNNGKTQYDFRFMDKEGYRVTIEGLSRSFDKEYWNYAILISGVIRQGMPMASVVDLISNLNLYDENINTWKNGVVRALKKFIPNGAAPKNDRKCKACGDEEGLVYEEGCLKCKSCGYTKCS